MIQFRAALVSIIHGEKTVVIEANYRTWIIDKSLDLFSYG